MRRFSVWLLFLASVALTGAAAQENFFLDVPRAFSTGQGAFPRTASSADFALVAWQESVKSARGARETGVISISLATRGAKDAEWKVFRRAIGSFPYSRELEPSIFTATIDDKGRIFICVARSPQQTEVYVSGDRGAHFSSYSLDAGGEASGASASGSQAERAAAADANGEILVPRIFQASGGAYLVFIVRYVGDAANLYYARSGDGVVWSAFEPFVQNPALRLNFLPSHVALRGKDYLVFQSFVSEAGAAGGVGGGRTSYQLYMQVSEDGGKTWSFARRVSDFGNPSGAGADAGAFSNERVHLSVFEGRIFMVWERRLGRGQPAIYGALLDDAGALAGQAERVNSAPQAACNNPVGFVFDGRRHVLWCDNRTGRNAVFWGTRLGADWENRAVSQSEDASIFPYPALLGQKVYLFWEDRSDKGSAIYATGPDERAEAPEIRALNFTSGKRIAGDMARLSWNVPSDPSGIRGFSWVWSRDPKAEPPPQVRGWVDSTRADEYANEDGAWYFKLKAQDFAGNWSPASQVVFVRDKTPPPAVRIQGLPLDAGGWAASNDLRFRWSGGDVPDLAGYSWELRYLGPAGPLPASVPAREPERAFHAVRVMGRQTSAFYENEDDGLWRFTVHAIDDVGNVSAAAALSFKTNKYVVRTYIGYLDASQELMGDLRLRIIGRGFAEDGEIAGIILGNTDESGYERTLSLASGEFAIVNDREIVAEAVENLPAGRYRVTLEHPRRGTTQAGETVGVGRSLTYKFGDYTAFWKASWVADASRRLTLGFSQPAFVAFVVLCALCLVAALRALTLAVAEGRAIRIETLAILNGSMMPTEKKKTLAGLRRRGVSLRVKLVSFSVFLVVAVVVMVAAPLYLMMTQNQQQTLKESLWDRSIVLLNSLELAAKSYFQADNVIEMGILATQTAAIPEARYITITGFSRETSASDNYVWASNDPDLLSKIDTPEYLPSLSRISDEVQTLIAGREAQLNATAREALTPMAKTVDGLSREAALIALRDDAVSAARRRNIQETSNLIQAEVQAYLKDLSSAVYSTPQYDTSMVRKEGIPYNLYKPIMFRQSGSDVYVRGWIRLVISSDPIILAVKEEQRATLRLIVSIALAAALMGTIGTLILANYIILPIRSLVSHVETIRDTEDKSELEGLDISIKTNDEIGALGDTINDMTHGLIKASLASKELMIGKEIQKKFIPLEVGTDGNKLTIGFKETAKAEFFGYYEGAKGVSGDYFDYRDLDGRHFAVIKCDVAGKGIPAALIMIQVATLFVNFLRRWKTRGGSPINDLVYEINDFIEQLGFKGRFAAFTLCLFDTETGALQFCNAGDNLIHYYDSSERKLKVFALPQTPAAGVLPNSIVEAGGGYKIQTFKLDPGDILLLYTDGIEEAKRKFRDATFAEIVCAEGGAPDSPHGNHVAGQDSEELGADRVEAIGNAVMNKKEYVLFKYHNPHGDIAYHFDFSQTAGGVEDLIMALVSVEKIFRLWRNPASSLGDKVVVDRKIDAFLKKCFVDYPTFIQETEEPAEKSAYVHYPHINEDEQYDDLTILGIKRKR
ncbi:MAG: SpoIIE family protein phosphatase [Spirochaetaceae bacterium]|jgi:hypothetical protein|nr:SpoIIE family protein phosphatase [Spirochaetaceae bacterium]